MKQARIELTDNTIDALVKMADGNPGAIGAMTDIIGNHERIDPQSILGAMGAIMSLDTYGIYGTDIYILWSDKCGRDVRKMLMIMRATQLGLFPESKLKQMAHDQSREITLSDEEWADLDYKVCTRLKDFAPEKDNAN